MNTKIIEKYARLNVDRLKIKIEHYKNENIGEIIMQQLNNNACINKISIPINCFNFLERIYIFLTISKKLMYVNILKKMSSILYKEMNDINKFYDVGCIITSDIMDSSIIFSGFLYLSDGDTLINYMMKF